LTKVAIELLGTLDGTQGWVDNDAMEEITVQTTGTVSVVGPDGSALNVALATATTTGTEVMREEAVSDNDTAPLTIMNAGDLAFYETDGPGSIVFTANGNGLGLLPGGVPGGNAAAVFETSAGAVVSVSYTFDEIQMLEVPEPCSFVLCVLTLPGFAMLCRGRRRRRG
jgi:hypothetical protein